MRVALLLLPLAALLPGQYNLYTCAVTSKGYVVGAKLPPSGLFVRTPSGTWQHLGFNHPYISAIEFDRRDPSLLYLSAGNGIIRAANGGRNWKILTGQDVTELRDLAVDPNAPGALYFGHTAGIGVTHNGGATWQNTTIGKRPYTESVRVDRTRAGHLVAGGEDGLYRSEDGGQSWRRSGAAGFEVMHIEQSPHDACHWLAVTQHGGLFVSHDCAVTFESAGRLGVDRNLYDIAFDPTTPGRIAIAGWGPGVVVSTDGGKSWQPRNQGLPSTEIWSVAFDPGHPGRLFASVHEVAVFLSEDAGQTWRRDGLEGSSVYRMKFVPQEAAR